MSRILCLKVAFLFDKQGINWKANGTSRRIIVFVTDAEFHCAGDGKVSRSQIMHLLLSIEVNPERMTFLLIQENFLPTDT